MIGLNLLVGVLENVEGTCCCCSELSLLWIEWYRQLAIIATMDDYQLVVLTKPDVIFNGPYALSDGSPESMHGVLGLLALLATPMPTNKYSVKITTMSLIGISCIAT